MFINNVVTVQMSSFNILIHFNTIPIFMASNGRIIFAIVSKVGMQSSIHGIDHDDDDDDGGDDDIEPIIADPMSSSIP